MDCGQLFQIPRFADAEASIVVLPRLVHPHSSRRSHRNDDQSRLLVVRRAVRRRRRRRIVPILLNSNMRDVRFGELAALVCLGEARLDDSSLLILEALSSRHVGDSSSRAHGGWITRDRVVESTTRHGRVRAVAHVAEAVRRAAGGPRHAARVSRQAIVISCDESGECRSMRCTSGSCIVLAERYVKRMISGPMRGQIGCFSSLPTHSRYALPWEWLPLCYQIEGRQWRWKISWSPSSSSPHPVKVPRSR